MLQMFLFWLAQVRLLGEQIQGSLMVYLWDRLRNTIGRLAGHPLVQRQWEERVERLGLLVMVKMVDKRWLKNRYIEYDKK